MSVSVEQIQQWCELLDWHDRDEESDFDREIALAEALNSAIAEIRRLRPDLAVEDDSTLIHEDLRAAGDPGQEDDYTMQKEDLRNA